MGVPTSISSQAPSPAYSPLLGLHYIFTCSSGDSDEAVITVPITSTRNYELVTKGEEFAEMVSTPGARLKILWDKGGSWRATG